MKRIIPADAFGFWYCVLLVLVVWNIPAGTSWLIAWPLICWLPAIILVAIELVGHYVRKLRSVE